MFNLIALLSCQSLFPLSDASTPGTMTAPAVPEVRTPVATRMPAGRLVTRQCFGEEREEMSSRGAAKGGGGAYGRSGGGPVMPAPAPMSAPSTVAPMKTASRAQAQSPAADAMAVAESAPPTEQGYLAEDDGAGEGTLGSISQEKKKDEATSFDAPTAPVRRQPSVDWGATVYLSNDDSMSLASAQRLLWAVQARGPVATSEVRPHEFLNYFSFDTLPVAPDHTFSVNAGAERTDGDTLTMAFAVKGVVPERKPLDLTMVLDRSGSMSAEGRMEYLKRGLHQMTAQLQQGDRVDMVLFDDELCTPIENFVVGRDDMHVLESTIDKLQPRGSTDLDLGLREGYRIANARSGGDVTGRNRRMMLISDALLNTGDVDPNTVSEVGRAYEQSGVRLTAIGVGRDFNDKVLDMLSEKGKGAYVYLGSEAVVDRVFGLGFRSLTETIAHDVRFALDLPPSLAMERFYGEESSTNPDDIQPINYYAGTTQLFLQDLKVDGTAVRTDPVKLTIEYTDPDTGRRESEVFTSTVGALLDADPRNLHKGQALMAWTDLILARSMNGNPCGAPFATWQDRVDTLGSDAEIQWLDGLTSPLCGSSPRTPSAPVANRVSYKVKVDSDLPIAEVSLACGGWHDTAALSSGSNVARFDARPGACTLTLQGTVPMVAQVEVPKTGADIRCTVRGGRLSCG
jgi:Ca-activated chloride channel family protein